LYEAVLVVGESQAFVTKACTHKYLGKRQRFNFGSCSRFSL